jgi:hypothetical protein
MRGTPSADTRARPRTLQVKSQRPALSTRSRFRGSRRGLGESSVKHLSSVRLGTDGRTVRPPPNTAGVEIDPVLPTVLQGGS